MLQCALHKCSNIAASSEVASHLHFYFPAYKNFNSLYISMFWGLLRLDFLRLTLYIRLNSTETGNLTGLDGDLINFRFRLLGDLDLKTRTFKLKSDKYIRWKMSEIRWKMSKTWSMQKTSDPQNWEISHLPIPGILEWVRNVGILSLVNTIVTVPFLLGDVLGRYFGGVTLLMISWKIIRQFPHYQVKCYQSIMKELGCVEKWREPN